MSAHPFANLPPIPAAHFKLYFYAAVLRVINQVCLSCESQDAALKQFPFLAGYINELAGHGLNGLDFVEAADWWEKALYEWEATVPGHLPLGALAEVAGLDYAALTLLLCVGLVEEDGRFGLLFETVQGMPGQHRPTFGLLSAWWQNQSASGDVRSTLRRLQELGLVRVVNPDAPRLEWLLQVPALLWDAMRGERVQQPALWARYHEPERLMPCNELIVPEVLRHSLAAVPSVLGCGGAQVLLIRGPQHNGRHAILGAVARVLGRGMLDVTTQGETSSSIPLHDERWRLLGPLATLLYAMPVITWDLGPGETAFLPWLQGYDGPVGVVMGYHGGVAGPGAEGVITLIRDLPDVHERRVHWQRAVGSGASMDEESEICERFRLSSGNIRRVMRSAQSYARLADRVEVTLSDVQRAVRGLSRQSLDMLAQPIKTFGTWSDLAAHATTLRELQLLEDRCRYRERLNEQLGETLATQATVGVRALFTGPSGTGKTMAARILASLLALDLYRLDLSSVVNKYIGETEKRLNQILTQAEELGVILLLDEGDSLLTQRTNVQSSNDRYANLETNFLLQRLETFGGIVLVTTNAADRIDSAFQRRMDVVVDFHPPDVAERLAIWQTHLPADHEVSTAVLHEIAARCELSGGQIRNTVLHASLLALSNGGCVTEEHIDSAILREYQKMNGVCPLRRTTAVVSRRR
jgi:ATP-dependent 26S proteasome regulatory subunit